MQLLLAMPTIMAGINQTIMMALSMVVIASMIGVKGLGQPVLKSITNQYFTLGLLNGLPSWLWRFYLIALHKHTPTNSSPFRKSHMTEPLIQIKNPYKVFGQNPTSVLSHVKRSNEEEILTKQVTPLG